MLARVQLPQQAKRGEVIEVRISIQHPMETGFRFDNAGRAIPKNVIASLVCRYNGEVVFRAEMDSGIAANPYLQFYTRAEASGEFLFEWADETGQRGTSRATITVSG